MNAASDAAIMYDAPFIKCTPPSLPPAAISEITKIKMLKARAERICGRISPPEERLEFIKPERIADTTNIRRDTAPRFFVGLFALTRKIEAMMASAIRIPKERRMPNKNDPAPPLDVLFRFIIKKASE